MSKMSRRIVVDASVAASAGEHVHPSSQRCREFMLDMLTICHKVVMSKDIKTEWEMHASNFSIKWLAAMRGKGKVVHVQPEPGDLWDQIQGAREWTAKESAAMEKDLLLLVAALESDHLIASCDEKVRQLFAEAAVHLRHLKSIMWVNPTADDGHHGDWLHAGCRHDPVLSLGRTD
jgi:hypothetical protein